MDLFIIGITIHVFGLDGFKSVFGDPYLRGSGLSTHIYPDSPGTVITVNICVFNLFQCYSFIFFLFIGVSTQFNLRRLFCKFPDHDPGFFNSQIYQFYLFV